MSASIEKEFEVLIEQLNEAEKKALFQLLKTFAKRNNRNNTPEDSGGDYNIHGKALKEKSLFTKPKK